MCYATVMVHLEVGHDNDSVLNVAAILAERFSCRIVGVAGLQPLQTVYSDGYVAAEVIDKVSAEGDREIRVAETAFRAAFQASSHEIEWRSASTFAPLFTYLAEQARCADLVVTGIDHNRSIFDTSRHCDVGELVMQVGRPVLIVPDAGRRMAFDKVMIGWKDTRESRRAVLDALPLLELAGHVSIVAIAGKDGLNTAELQVRDVTAWLGHHGIVSEPMAVLAEGDDATQLGALAEDGQVDLLVAGAYGHSRLTERVFGGVTRDLMMKGGRCALVSH